MSRPSLDSLLERVESRGDPALWHRLSDAWTPGGDAPGRDIKELAAALVHFGITGGRAALVLGREGPDTARAALGVLAAGACLVRLDAAVPDTLLLEALASCRVALVIVEDDRQLERVLAFRPDLPDLEMVVLLSGETKERKAAALLVGAAVDVGAARLAQEPDLLRAARAGSPADGAALVVSSQGGLRSLGRAELAEAAYGWTDEVSIGPGRTVLLALPDGAAESLPLLLGALARDAIVLVVPDGERPDTGLKERPPDGAIVSARALSRIHAAWKDDMDRSSWPIRTITRWALEQGADPARHPRRFRLADLTVLAHLRGRWGGRLRGWGLVGGPASHEVSTFFASAGVPIYVMPGLASLGMAR